MNKEGKQWTKKETKIQKNKQTPVLTNLLYMCLYLYVFASLRIVVFCCFLLFAALFAVWLCMLAVSCWPWWLSSGKCGVFLSGKASGQQANKPAVSATQRRCSSCGLCSGQWRQWEDSKPYQALHCVFSVL